MEQSLSSLTYKGSIPEAITEAKKQRKLFVVYISGEDAESRRLESLTWTDVKVAEAVSKFCILLHLSEGSNDAIQFSALYPQRSIPCITAVGYNGIQTWKNEGFVIAEVLASSLENMWLSLRIQTMDQSLSSLTYKGSNLEAITEAKKQRKLFVVYISGEDAESSRLESLTWADVKVAEAVSKYCILLHLSEGSNDATQFSAIYPQRSIPCITTVGCNGIQIWKNEGFVSAEVLASSLEKVWLSLHIQDTTAAVLRSALASKTSEPSTSGVSSTAPSDEGSSNVSIQSPSTSKHSKSSEAKINVRSDKAQKETSDTHTVEDKGGEFGDTPSSRSFQADDVGFSGSGKSSASTEAGKELQHPTTVDLDNTAADEQPSRAIDGSHSHEKANDSDLLDLDGGPKSPSIEANQIVQDSKGKVVDDKTAVAIEKLSDVHLNIRMPYGPNLQKKFSVTSTLRMVKEFIDEHQESFIGSYDLAIPYPHKVYSYRDLSRTLLELGLFDRQALIVVPWQQTIGQSNTRTIVESLNESDAGYFFYGENSFSFINPLSYLGGGSSSAGSGQQSQHDPWDWEYSSNSMPQNNFTQAQRPYYAAPSSNISARGGNGSRSRQPTTSRFGSNIHTLRRDEDDEQFKDNNTYWNSNSTQYGGNDNGN